MEAGGVSPTLNAFDNGHESRATVLAVLGDKTHALTSEEHGTPSRRLLGGEGVSTAVRRLTPRQRECERLQGFQDDWTAHRVDLKSGEVVAQADSARYRQMGNAVAVPVVEWIVGRIVAADGDL